MPNAFSKLLPRKNNPIARSTHSHALRVFPDAAKKFLAMIHVFETPNTLISHRVNVDDDIKVFFSPSFVNKSKPPW